MWPPENISARLQQAQYKAWHVCRVVWTHLTYGETGTPDHKSNLVDLTKELEKAQLVGTKPNTRPHSELAMLILLSGLCKLCASFYDDGRRR